MLPQIFLRVDSSLEIGSGHVIRCLALARELSEAGADCYFICRELKGNSIQIIESNNFKVHRLPLAKKHSKAIKNGNSNYYLENEGWLQTTQCIDAKQTIEVISAHRCDMLIVDHYALDLKWENEVKQYCRKIAVIDDLANREHLCDLLLDQNISRVSSDYLGLTPNQCRLFLGPRYALLRREFREMRDYSLNRRRAMRLETILITMGGIDRENYSSQILDALRSSCLSNKDLKINIVMGLHAPHLKAVKVAAFQMASDTRILVNIGGGEMARLMADADLIVSAAGGTLWETCCLGVPSIIKVVAENQRRSANFLASSGSAILLSEGKIHVDEFECKIACLSKGSFMQEMHNRAISITKGDGAELFSSEILNAILG